MGDEEDLRLWRKPSVGSNKRVRLYFARENREEHMRRTWITAASLSLLLLVPLMGRANARDGLAAPASPHLYIVFMPGLCGWQYSDPYCHGNVNAQARARATFATLITALSHAHARYTPIYYSYDLNHPDYYTVGDTHQAVGTSTDALEKQVRGVWQRDPQAGFDLVGHSLGGVVAASWAVTDGRQYGLVPSRGLLQRVQSIVTFDSPVKGIRGPLTSNIITRLFGGAVWYSLQPDQETIKEITFFPASWWRTVGHLHTVANVDDQIVPASEASLGDTRLVRDGACSKDILFFRSCHGAVLSDSSLNGWVVRHWLIPAIPATAVPTRIPTPEIPTQIPTPAKTITPPLPVPEGTAQPTITRIAAP